MALQLSFDDKYGSTHASAYHRVYHIEMHIAQRIAKVLIGTYVDATARSNGKAPLEYTEYVYTDADYDAVFDDANMNPVDKNPIKNVYDEIKGRPEWAGASDV